MIDIDAIAKNLSHKTNHRFHDWHKALSAAINDAALSQMTDGEILHFTQALMSPDQLNWLLEAFRAAMRADQVEMPFDAIIRHVTGSQFPLVDWLESLHHVALAARKEKLPTDLTTLLQYVSGCVGRQTTEFPLGTPLSEVVELAIAQEGLTTAR